MQGVSAHDCDNNITNRTIYGRKIEYKWNTNALKPIEEVVDIRMLCCKCWAHDICVRSPIGEYVRIREQNAKLYVCNITVEMEMETPLLFIFVIFSFRIWVFCTTRYACVLQVRFTVLGTICWFVLNIF